MNDAVCGERRRAVPPSTLVRWCKFNLVGGIGIVVQFGALFLLKSVLHFEYLAATAIAVEAAVVHNFVWHEQFTWADRIGVGRLRTSGAEAHSLSSRIFAALKRCATQKPASPDPAIENPATPNSAAPNSAIQDLVTQNSATERAAARGFGTQMAAAQWLHWASLRRLVRFHLSNGAVSIVGNLALMKVMVGMGQMNYLVANAIAITVCSLVNFMVSEIWVFDTE